MNFKDFYKSLRENENFPKIALICAAVVTILIIGIICTVNAYTSEMQRIKEVTTAEEERQQIADEEEQRRLEELSRQ